MPLPPTLMQLTKWVAGAKSQTTIASVTSFLGLARRGARERYSAGHVVSVRRHRSPAQCGGQVSITDGGSVRDTDSRVGRVRLEAVGGVVRHHALVNVDRRGARGSLGKDSVSSVLSDHSVKDHGSDAASEKQAVSAITLNPRVSYVDVSSGAAGIVDGNASPVVVYDGRIVDLQKATTRAVVFNAISWGTVLARDPAVLDEDFRGGEYFDAVEAAAGAVNRYPTKGHGFSDVVHIGNVDNDAVDRSVQHPSFAGWAAVNCD